MTDSVDPNQVPLYYRIRARLDQAKQGTIGHDRITMDWQEANERERWDSLLAILTQYELAMLEIAAEVSELARRLPPS